MVHDEFEVVIVGGGAAGIGAGRRLHEAGVSCLMVEARERLGGRGWTDDASGFALDLGCGWLHSADRNPWVDIAERQGRSIDKSPPPWSKPSLPYGFSPEEQDEFHEMLSNFFAQVGAETGKPDRAAVDLLPRGGRWNALVNAINTYVSGAELDRLSVRDLANYDGNDVNWRVVEGYGTVIAAHAAGVPAALGCPILAIDHSGTRIKIESAKGTLTAGQVIVTLPTSLIASEAVRFTPTLPEKTEAARGLPLGLADKLFLALNQPEAFEADCSLFGDINHTSTAAYQFRPFGRPMIEAYFGGVQAAELEAGGDAAFFDFAVGELTARTRQRFRQTCEADRHPPLGRRSAGARLLLVRVAGQGRLPADACQAGRQPAVLRRRGLLDPRLLHRARRVAHRHRRRRTGVGNAGFLVWSTIFFENRCPHFGIML